MKLYWFFYKEIFWANLALSLLLSQLSGAGLQQLKMAPLLFATAGFGISVLMYSYTNRKNRFMYYNKGIAYKKVILLVFLFNFTFCALLWQSLQYL
ncbi:hypothetical protein ACL9RF_11795 [Sphingobacterium sp. Mn56C]